MTVPSGPHLLAVDIGGTKIALAVAETAATGARPYLAVDRIATPATAAEALAGLLAAGRRLIGDRTLAGIGVSFGGQVRQPPSDPLRSLHVPGWQNIDLQAELTRAWGAPTLIANDANTAARGEYACLPVGRHPATLVYLTVSTGIGAAVIIDGRPHPGPNGLAGEIGHLPIISGGAACGCGGAGHLEALASGTAIARNAVAALTVAHRPSALHEALAIQGAVTAGDVAEAARRGDPLAVELLADAGALVGHAVAVMALVLDPDLVLIGGGVAESGRAFWDPLRRAAEAETLRMPTLQLAGLRTDSALRGALELATDASLVSNRLQRGSFQRTGSASTSVKARSAAPISAEFGRRTAAEIDKGVAR